MKVQPDTTYIELDHKLYSFCNPTKVINPQLVIWNNRLANKLDLNTNQQDISELAAIFSGNKLPEHAKPIAQAYCGHQFGHFNRLGDGRAILLGELLAPNGVRYDMQLKGSGITPYSRRGDGRATLSSMLREYIISEAMVALGIPTTQSLAVVSTGEKVYRENVQDGAVLTRIAASHIRVGTFEFASKYCSVQTLHELCCYSINRHYPDLNNAANKALALLQAVMSAQIDLIIHWQRVGFIHGVMNTDNMSISGETIDYGPCAYINSYKPETVFSSIDTGGRYAFGNQPAMAHWNLSRFAESLLPIIDADSNIAISLATEVLNKFQHEFQQKYLHMLANKIGFAQSSETSKILIQDLLKWMYQNNADYNNTFVKLMYNDAISDSLYEQKAFLSWKKRWDDALSGNNAAFEIMKKTNPVVIPRNHKVEEVLSETISASNTTSIHNLLESITSPYLFTNECKSMLEAPGALFEQQYKTFCGT